VVVCVGGAGVGAGATATGATAIGALAIGAAALTVLAPDPGARVASCPAPPPKAADAATALVVAVDAAIAASVRWSAAMTAESRASVTALVAFWLTATVVALDVVALDVGMIVELTKALASPAPIRAIEVTTTEGRIRRRVRDRRSARAPAARFAAMRSLATSNSSGSIASLSRFTEEFVCESGLVVTTASVRTAVVVAG
jgi:hypothetical protein